MSSPFTFNYHAGALALGGVRKFPDGVTQIIPSVAQAELSPCGGEGSEVVYNYNQGDISFSHARSTVVGRSNEAYDTFTTTTEVYITDLNVFGRIKAGMLFTHVTSTRTVDPLGDPLIEGEPDRSTFSLYAFIRDLVIDGVEVAPQYDVEITSPVYGTYDALTAKLKGEPKKYEKRFDIPDGKLLDMIAKRHAIRGNLYYEAQCSKTATVARATRGVKVKVGGLGHLHLGELLVNQGHRRVNLLRLKLDSSVDALADDTLLPANAAFSALRTGAAPPGGPGHDDGEMAFISVDGNGTPSWP